ncbi:MAG: DUF4446 family protein [Lachnospiraceae bacterium]|jgi:uncharacterized protein YoxC|nr:DUF4446 family protein [Lachnospiraceae bacterium]
MNSDFLTMIGLGGIDIGYILVGIVTVLLIVLILLIVLLVKYSNIKKRYDKFMKGKNASSLEDDMHGVFEDMKLLKTNTDRNKKDIRILYKNMEKTFQKLGIVKYDAFNQMGGQLSFSLALLDENNDGFIINSVHSSEGCYSYTKEIKNGTSPISLGAEEEQALNIAMGRQTK